MRKGGTFLLNTIREGDELAKNVPNKIKRYLAENDITLYYINASKIAQEIGPGNRTNTILQSAFFRITNVIPVDLAVEQMKKFIVKSYSNKGQNVVDTLTLPPSTVEGNTTSSKQTRRGRISKTNRNIPLACLSSLPIWSTASTDRKAT